MWSLFLIRGVRLALEGTFPEGRNRVLSISIFRHSTAPRRHVTGCRTIKLKGARDKKRGSEPAPGRTALTEIKKALPRFSSPLLPFHSLLPPCLVSLLHSLPFTLSSSFSISFPTPLFRPSLPSSIIPPLPPSSLPPYFLPSFVFPSFLHISLSYPPPLLNFLVSVLPPFLHYFLFFLCLLLPSFFRLFLPPSLPPSLFTWKLT